MENILILVKRGCDFIPNSPESKISDVGNYRVFVRFVDRFGIEVVGDFARRATMRFTAKNGRQLKNPVVEVTNMLHADLQYTTEDGQTYGYNTLGAENDCEYTIEGIIKAVNRLSKTQFISAKVTDPYKIGDEFTLARSRES